MTLYLFCAPSSYLSSAPSRVASSSFVHLIARMLSVLAFIQQHLLLLLLAVYCDTIPECISHPKWCLRGITVDVLRPAGHLSP
eukprot:2974643-Pleurochrysis_carterae.AAC.4